MVLNFLKLQHIPWSSTVFICFSKAFSKEENINLACCMIWIWSEYNISSPVRYSFLSILSDDNAYIFGASLLT